MAMLNRTIRREEAEKKGKGITKLRNIAPLRVRENRIFPILCDLTTPGPWNDASNSLQGSQKEGNLTECLLHNLRRDLWMYDPFT